MDTLVENAAEVATCATAIDAAIVAKGGTTAGGLRNAATGIASIPSGETPPSKDVSYYVSGSAHMYDGWESGGAGVQNPVNSTSWIDLSGENDITVSADGYAFGNGHIIGSAQTGWGFSGSRVTESGVAFTIEICLTLLCSSTSTTAVVSDPLFLIAFGGGRNFTNLNILWKQHNRRNFPQAPALGTPFTISISINASGDIVSARYDDTEMSLGALDSWSGSPTVFGMNANSKASNVIIKFHNIRCYHRALTDAERTANYNLDRERFNF